MAPRGSSRSRCPPHRWSAAAACWASGRAAARAAAAWGLVGRGGVLQRWTWILKPCRGLPRPRCATELCQLRSAFIGLSLLAGRSAYLQHTHSHHNPQRSLSSLCRAPARRPCSRPSKAAGTCMRPAGHFRRWTIPHCTRPAHQTCPAPSAAAVAPSIQHLLAAASGICSGLRSRLGCTRQRCCAGSSLGSSAVQQVRRRWAGAAVVGWARWLAHAPRRVRCGAAPACTSGCLASSSLPRSAAASPAAAAAPRPRAAARQSLLLPRLRPGGRRRPQAPPWSRSGRRGKWLVTWALLAAPLQRSQQCGRGAGA